MSFETAITLDELNKASVECAKSVKRKESVQKYLINKAVRNERLREDIVTGKYKLSKYHEFTITEPKVRHIHATEFRDRTWQRAMCNNGLRHDLTKSFIYDNGACQKGKGTEFAVERTIRFLQYTYRVSGGNDFYYRHLDVQSFFPNTPHKVLKELIRERVTEPRFIPYIDEIIDSCKDRRPQEEIDADPFGERGTILGSEIGQMMQLALPDKIDHYVKETIKLHCYLRYNDDFLLIGADKEQLLTARNYIVDEMAKLGLTVKDKTGLQKVKHGIHFMKKRFLIKSNGKVIVLPEQSKISKERKTLKKLKQLRDNGAITDTDVKLHYQSKVGGMSKCNINRTLEHLDKCYENIFNEKPIYRRDKKNAFNRRKRNRKAVTCGKRITQEQVSEGKC